MSPALARGRTDQGVAYHVQAMAPGTHVRIDERIAQRVIDAVEIQRDLAPHAPHCWSDWIESHPTPSTDRRLQERCEWLRRQVGDVRLPRTDLVQGNLDSSNLLVDGDRISFVDVQDLGSGTRAYDLVGMLLSAHMWDDTDTDARALLHDAPVRVAGLEVAILCAVFAALTCLDHFVEHGRDAQRASPKLIAMLEDIAR